MICITADGEGDGADLQSCSWPSSMWWVSIVPFTIRNSAADDQDDVAPGEGETDAMSHHSVRSGR